MYCMYVDPLTFSVVMEGSQEGGDVFDYVASKQQKQILQLTSNTAQDNT